MREKRTCEREENDNWGKKREAVGLYAGDKKVRGGEEIFVFTICKSDELEMGLPC
jgi:hypothetical protein